MARLLANIPVLKAGFPPIIIPKERRRDYIQALSKYHLAVGTITAGDDLLPAIDKLDDFKRLCQESWFESHMIATLIQSTKTGRPCGNEAFTGIIEGITGRRLTALSVGRPKKLR